uniref:ANK_REP_REGION domain-containing protein n=1 Tax=Globodera rostochiensis TaxID=31243 RepID=A0A914GS96_GLORO
MPTNHKKAPKIASSEALGDEADGRGGAEGSSRTSLVPSSGGVDASGKKKKSNKKKKKKAPPFADNDGAKVPKKNIVAGEEEEDSFGEKNKHRNSLTDSPLTGLSPSSAASNGDSADDTEVAKSSSKQTGGSSSGTASNSSSNFYVVNAAPFSLPPPLPPPSSSFSAMCEQQQQNMHFLAEITEEENINEIEREYAYEILNNQKKHLIKQLGYNKWTEQLCRSIIAGDFRAFHRRFKMVMVCLRKRKPAQYGQLTDMQLASHVAEMVVDKFHNKEERTTILMILLANSDREAKCADRGHGYCRIAHMLLKLLGRKQLEKLLELSTAKAGKNALHLATATGQPCQVQVLLALTDIDANRFDLSMRAALHYAVERNNLDMVRLLMWYGADISLCHSCNAFFDPLQLSLCANPNSSVQHWLADRVDALSSKIRSFVRRLCARCFSVRTALSPVHFVRFGAAQRNNSQILRNCQLNLRANANRSSCSTLTQLLKQNAKSKIILFIVPVSFRTADKFSAASDPKIVHVEFPDNAYIVSTSVMYNSQTPAKALNNTVLSRKHNSHFYAFELSSSSCVEGLHKLMLNIKSNTGFSDDSRAVLLAIQAYLCVEQPAEIDNDGNNNNGNSGQRAKEKAKLD